LVWCIKKYLATLIWSPCFSGEEKECVCGNVFMGTRVRLDFHLYRAESMASQMPGHKKLGENDQCSATIEIYELHARRMRLCTYVRSNWPQG
jgi:hypothetical protein